MSIVDLVLDFSWFCRREASWGWGPADEEVWHSRYEAGARGDGPEVHRECDPDKHADVTPTRFWQHGIAHLNLFPNRLRRLGLCERPEEAMALLQRGTDLLLLVAPDHGASASSDTLSHADNWLTNYHKACPDTALAHLYPSWRTVVPEPSGPVPRLQIWPWPSYNTAPFRLRLRDLILVRNSAYHPPHLEFLFAQLVQRIARETLSHSRAGSIGRRGYAWLKDYQPPVQERAR